MTAWFTTCFIASLLCCHLALGQLDGSHKSEWNAWKAKYHKKYSSLSEELVKRAVWEKNLVLVKEHNSRPGATFKLAMNQYGDFEQMTHSPSQSHPVKNAETNRSAIPKSVDWRKKGVVTSVHDQGGLGQSGAFAAADAVASFHAIHTGHLANPSAKEVADCCTPQQGVDIFDCIHKLGGLCTNTSYKGNSGKCNSQSCTPYAKVPSGGHSVARGSEEALALAVVIEPVVVIVDASQVTFQLYSSGVYVDQRCSPTEVDHAMLVVGYGTTKDGIDYWICKNCWGKLWGMDGYILMARNHHNMCGIATEAGYPF